jgi:hypothetical protein
LTPAAYSSTLDLILDFLAEEHTFSYADDIDGLQFQQEEFDEQLRAVLSRMDRWAACLQALAPPTEDMDVDLQYLIRHIDEFESSFDE